MADLCELCGHPTDSRTHLEGLGDIHVRKAPEPADETTTSTSGEVVVVETTASDDAPPEPSPTPRRGRRK